MKIYLVGGAIRNQLLGLPVTERDWVVVESSPEDLIQLGYKAVGKDFPVFLHPETKEEYALARTERKISKGYKGFQFYFAPDVSLEQDLRRRDLTINAIAQDADGNLIDPFNGQQDCQQQLFRHVSPAFAEDPVRILRVARFASLLPQFTVAAETNTLMQTMVQNGEVDALVAERVWRELVRALSNTAPSRFFSVLQDCDAQLKLWPEFNSDSLAYLDTISAISTDPELRFAALWHSLNLAQLTAFQQRYRIPQTFYDLAKLIISYGDAYRNLNKDDASAIHQLLTQIDAWRRPQRLIPFCTLLDARSDSPLQQLLHQSLNAAKAVDTQAIQQQGFTGPDFAKALRSQQVAAIQNLITSG